MRQVGGFKKYKGSTNLVIPNLVGGRTTGFVISSILRVKGKEKSGTTSMYLA